MAFVQWENWDSRQGGWTAVSSSTSRRLEEAFRDPTITSSTIQGLAFDLERMEYPTSKPLRRVKSDAPAACMYHDGCAFVALNKYDSTLLIDAKLYGRDQVSFYMTDLSTVYDVSLSDPPTQTNRNTGTNRALYIPSLPTVQTDDHEDDDEHDEDEDVFNEELIESMPEEMSKPLTCPITNEIMRKPVVTSDGHSYEKSAIIRWLLTKNKSPMTGKIMHDQTLVPNHNLKQFICTLKRDKKVGEPSSGKRKKIDKSGPHKKKMRA